jgi:hypothetical protein
MPLVRTRRIASASLILACLAAAVACGSDAPAAGVDAAPSVTHPSNPGRVSCGASECDLVGDAGLCCLPGPTGPGPSCLPGAGYCESSNILSCDEPADCPAGTRCCPGPDASRDYFGCWTSCAGPALCKSALDCAAGEPCTDYTCQGLRVSVCGELPAADLARLHCAP